MPKKRLEKTTPPVSAPMITGTAKFYCCRCGTAYSRQKGYFPVSHSPMYRGSGFLPICSECVDDMFNYYRQKLGDDRAAMKRMCLKLDLYWNDKIYDMVEKTAGINSYVRNYIAKTNIIRYIDKSFDNTIEEDPAFASAAPQPVNGANPETGVEIPQSIIDFWGAGFTPRDYLEYNQRYEYWVKELPSGVTLDLGTKALLRQIVIAESEVTRLRGRGDALDKAQKTLNDLLGSALLKPAQQKEDPDAELDNMPLGVGIRDWENDRPLPATPEDQKDKSRTIKNITTWFLGHACKMVGLKNSYVKMYEDEMARLRVTAPEFEDEDDDAFLSDLFGDAGDGGDE